MHWEEEKDEEGMAIPERVVDLSFVIDCKTLPVDHAWALFAAIEPILPWLRDDPIAAIHPLHVAESAHGWQRPEEPDALLHLSRRTKLVLRLPHERVAEARQLEDQAISVNGHQMVVGEGTVQLLNRSTSLFARRLVIEEGENEASFLQRQVDALHAIGVRPKKMLPGLSHPINTPQGEICTRLLSLEGLSMEESFRLQEQGLGSHRHLGCGIFIAHKPLANVKI